MSDLYMNGPLWFGALLERLQEHKDADAIIFMKDGKPIGSINAIMEMCPVGWLLNLVHDIHMERTEGK